MAHHAQRTAGGHRFAGHRTPDFSLHQHVALGCQRLHGRGAAAQQGIHAQARLPAAGAHRQAHQKNGDAPEGGADREGHPGANSQLRYRRGYKGQHSEGQADDARNGQYAMAAELGFKQQQNQRRHK